MRINKYLAKHSKASRRKIDQAIEAGEVLVNKSKAKLGQILEAGDIISYQGKNFNFTKDTPSNDLYIALYKPQGVVSTLEPNEPNNIIDYLKSNPGKCLSDGLLEQIVDTKIYPIGRLDKNSRGLIILTNDGDLTQKLTHPKFEHEKEYIVSCTKKINKKFIEAFSAGVTIPKDNEEDSELVTTTQCQASIIDSYSFKTTLKQGYNRQIRKMVKTLSNEVRDLLRVRIEGLALAEYRVIAPNSDITILEELAEGDYLKLKCSSSLITGG